MRVDGMINRRAGKACGELEARSGGALKKDSYRGIAALEPLEGADDAVSAVADAVAVEIEAAIAAPRVAATIDGPPRARVSAAQHDVAPVVVEAVFREGVSFGTGKQRHRGVVRAKDVSGKAIRRRTVEQEAARVFEDDVPLDGGVVAILERQPDSGNAAVALNAVLEHPDAARIHDVRTNHGIGKHVSSDRRVVREHVV